MNTTMIPASNAQVVDVYESGVPIEAIASEFNYEVDAVKLILLQCSKVYQRAVTGIKSLELLNRDMNDEPISDTFTSDDEIMAKNAIRSLARESEMDNVRLKAAIYVVDERKGRNDAIKNLARAGGVGGFNITVVNNHFKEMRAAMARAKSAKVVQLESCAA